MRLSPTLLRLSRRLTYPAIAAILATGAPMGLLMLWSATAPGDGGEAPGGPLVRDVPTLLYVGLSTLAAFTAFGYVLGRHADALADLSRTDSLTGLRNQRAFEERLEEEVARAARYGSPLSLLIADIDGLKAINDQHGHDAGNLALRAVAGALRLGARQSDLASRIGGDEFAIIAPSTDARAARALGERIRSLVAEVADTAGALTISVGVATLGPERAGSSALLRSADRALYEAKRQGRNCVASTWSG